MTSLSEAVVAFRINFFRSRQDRNKSDSNIFIITVLHTTTTLPCTSLIVVNLEYSVPISSGADIRPLPLRFSFHVGTSVYPAKSSGQIQGLCHHQTVTSMGPNGAFSSGSSSTAIATSACDACSLYIVSPVRSSLQISLTSRHVLFEESIVRLYDCHKFDSLIHELHKI